MVRSKYFVAIFALAACSGAKTSDQGTPSQSSSVAGVWVGSEGPNQSALKPTAKLELTVDGGEVTGIWYSKDPSTGNSEPVAFLGGTQDGGGSLPRFKRPARRWETRACRPVHGQFDLADSH